MCWSCCPPRADKKVTTVSSSVNLPSTQQVALVILITVIDEVQNKNMMHRVKEYQSHLSHVRALRLGGKPWRTWKLHRSRGSYALPYRNKAVKIAFGWLLSYNTLSWKYLRNLNFEFWILNFEYSSELRLWSSISPIDFLAKGKVDEIFPGYSIDRVFYFDWVSCGMTHRSFLGLDFRLLKNNERPCSNPRLRRR